MKASSRTRFSEEQSRRARQPRISPDLKPSKPGADFAKVPVGDGRYTFFITESTGDLNLSHPYVQRVEEQLHDPDFIVEWRRYMQYNNAANRAYTDKMLQSAVYHDYTWGEAA